MDNMYVYVRLFITTTEEGLGDGEGEHSNFHVELGDHYLSQINP